VAAAPGLVVIDEAYNAFARKTFMTRLANFRISWSCVRVEARARGHSARLCRRRPEWIREFDKVRPPYNVSMLTHVVAGAHPRRITKCSTRRRAASTRSAAP